MRLTVRLFNLADLGASQRCLSDRVLPQCSGVMGIRSLP